MAAQVTRQSAQLQHLLSEENLFIYLFTVMLIGFHWCCLPWNASLWCLPTGHVAVCVRGGCKGQGMGKKMSVFSPPTCLLCHYSHFELLPVAVGGPSPAFSFPASPSFLCLSCCSQWQVSDTVWSNSSSWESVSVPVSQEQPLGQVLFPCWPYYGFCIAHWKPRDQQHPALPEWGLQSEPGSLWIFPLAKEITNSFLHRGADSCGRWSNSQISG